MRSMFSQNRIGSARIGTAATSVGNLSSVTNAQGFRFRANVAKQLSSVTIKGNNTTGSPTSAEIPLYLCKPILGVAYKIATVTSGAATITLNGHQLQNGEQILMFGTTLPTGASAKGTIYYVVNTATNTFNLSLTQGGSAITWSSTGTNVCFARYLDRGNIVGSFSDTYLDFVGFTYTFTVGKLYYFLATNLRTDPSLNSTGFLISSNVFETSNDMSRWHTTNLTTYNQDTLSIGLNGSINYSDGTKLECRINAVSTGQSISAQSSVNTYYRGNRFKTMPDAKIRLIAAAFKLTCTISAATTTQKYYVCDLLDNSDNLIATSQQIDLLDYATTTVYLIPFFFDTVQVLEADTTYKLRVRVTYTGSDTSCGLSAYSVTFNVGADGTSYHQQIWNNGSSAVMFTDSFKRVNGSAETTEASLWYPCELWLDDTDPYNATSGGSSYSYTYAY